MQHDLGITLVLLIFLVWTGTVRAGQQVTVSPEGEVRAAIAAEAQSRIHIPGHRIATVRAVGGLDNTLSELTLEHDATTGDLYVLPRDPESRTPITLFVTTERGQRTYQLTLLPEDRPSAQVFIRDPLATSPAHTAINPTLPYHERILSLVSAMSSGQWLDGYERQAGGDRLRLWRRVWLRAEQVYTGAQFEGVVYALVNDTEATLHMSEQEFYRPGVRAVKLDQSTVHPGDTVRVLLVADRGSLRRESD